MVNAETIVRIADRFLGRQSKNSIARAGFLKPIICLLSVFYLLAFVWIFYLEHKIVRCKKTVISNLLVQFIAPEPPKIVVPDKIENEGAAGAPAKPKLGSPAVQAKVAKPAPVVAVLPKLPVIKPIIPPPAKINTARPNTPDHPVSPPQETTKTTAAVTSPKAPSLITAPAAPATGVGNTDQGQPAGTGAGTGSQPGAGGDAGNKNGAGVGTLAMALPHTGGAATAMGNIAPYRKEMLMRLAENWHPKRLQGNIVLVLTLSAAGQLINAEILNSSGDEKLDQYALDTVHKTAFAPLPTWFTGSQLRIKVELARVEAMKRGT